MTINLILLNYNKNYSFSADEKKELKYCLLMYEGGLKPIKYQTIKVELIHTLLKGIKTLFYYCYFPGPNSLSKKAFSMENNKRYKKMLPIANSTFSSYFSSSITSLNNTPNKKSPNKKIPSSDLNEEAKLFFDSFFNNLTCLRNKDK